MRLAQDLREAVRRAAARGDVRSPRNIEVEVNVGRDGSTAVASASQDAEIVQDGREGRVDGRR